LSGEADAAAREIIAKVQAEGDAALIELTQKFEGRELTPDTIEMSPERRREATKRVPDELREALEDAATRVLTFHRTQEFQSSSLYRPGATLESRVSPLRRVAVYAPGGTAAYPSSVLMAGIPAKVAGVPELILLTPRASDVVVLAAEFAGIDRIFEVGGAQAVAAAALGTDTIPRVDKIVGPGNAYVTAAKRQVYGLCDIDSIAGPSEIMVVADRNADPGVVAADLISQAEHDLLACPILVTDHEPLLEQVDEALREQLSDLPRSEIATVALHEHGAAVLVKNHAGMIHAANQYAPEHLELLTNNAAALAAGITAAGAIFVGGWTPEAAGDYTAGPSHVLPTAGAARFASPVGVWDFVKYTSVLELTENGLREQAHSIITLARAEGLEGHARAVERRLLMVSDDDEQ
jgi:histidinol dehydrogenase